MTTFHVTLTKSNNVRDEKKIALALEQTYEFNEGESFDAHDEADRKFKQLLAEESVHIGSLYKVKCLVKIKREIFIDGRLLDTPRQVTLKNY